MVTASADAVLDDRAGPVVDLLDRELGRRISAYQIAVRQGGEVVLSTAGGRTRQGADMATTTPCYLTSGSKCVLAVALGRLWERGDVDLFRSLQDLLPHLRFADPRIGGLRLVDALSYGLPCGLEDDPYIDPAVSTADLLDVIAALVARRPDKAATESSYSFWTWSLACELMHRVTGDLPGLLQEVFDDLGMSSARLGAPPGPLPLVPFGQSEDAVPAARGGPHPKLLELPTGIWSSAADVSALMASLLPGAATRAVRQCTALFLTSRWRSGYAEHHGDVVDWGVGFEIESNWYRPNPSISFSPACGRRTFGHKGYAGYSTFADPDRSLCATIFANADGRGAKARSFGHHLRSLIAEIYRQYDQLR